MAKYHILFGFDEPDVVTAIVNAVKGQNNIVEFSCRTTKNTIQEYVYYHPACTTIVLREVMGNESYSAEELAEFNDVKHYNIIVVLDEQHKGKDYVQTLYSAGITSAILLEQKKGATPAQIAELILNPRTRRRAREVYGIAQVKAGLNILTSDSYLSNYALLMNENVGINIIDRYLMVIKGLTIAQGVDFTKKLPANIKKILMEYEEYYKVQDFFIKNGVPLTYRKSKVLKQGMSDMAFQSYIQAKVRENRNARARKESMPMKRRPANSQSRGAMSDYISYPVPKKQPEQTYEQVAAGQDSLDIIQNIFMEDSSPPVTKQEDVYNPTIDDVGENMETDTISQFNDGGGYISGNMASTPYGEGTVAQRPVIIDEFHDISGPPPSAYRTYRKPPKQRRREEPLRKQKKKINWKILLMIAFYGVLCLIIWLFVLKTMYN